MIYVLHEYIAKSKVWTGMINDFLFCFTASLKHKNFIETIGQDNSNKKNSFICNNDAHNMGDVR